MRKISMIMLSGVLAVSFLACNRKPKTSCVYGDKIPVTVLDPVTQMGNSIAIMLEQDRFEDIYNTAGDMFKRAQTPEQFKVILQSLKENLGPLEYSKLEEAYYLKNKAGRKYETVMVPCSLGEENMNDIYQVPKNSEIVSLIYGVRAGEENADIFMEMIKQGASWKLLSIVLTPTTFHGKKVDDFVSLGRKAREENKLRLATLYYKIAYLLSNISPNVDEYVARKTLEEMGQIKTDYVPLGELQVWNIDAETKPEVFNLDVIFEKGEPWVEIEWIAPDLGDTAKLASTSDKILDFAFKNFPEYRDFFKGIVVTARSRDPKLVNQAFRRVRSFSEGKK